MRRVEVIRIRYLQDEVQGSEDGAPFSHVQASCQAENLEGDSPYQRELQKTKSGPV